MDQRPLTTSKDHTQPTYRVHNKRHPQISDRDWMVDLVPRLSESHLAWGFTTFTSSSTPTSMQSYSLAFSRKAIPALRAQHYPHESKLKLLHMVARINDASPLRCLCTETYIKLRKYCISVLRAGRFLLASKNHPKLEVEKHTIDVADRARTTTEDCRALDYN